MSSFVKTRRGAGFGLGIILLFASGSAFRDSKAPLFRDRLDSFQAVPAAPTRARGQFRATVINDATIAWALNYSGLEGTVIPALNPRFGRERGSYTDREMPV